MFPCTTTTNGLEPWISDGTVAGTKLLKDLVPGAASGFSQTWGLKVGATTYFTPVWRPATADLEDRRHRGRHDVRQGHRRAGRVTSTRSAS